MAQDVHQHGARMSLVPRFYLSALATKSFFRCDDVLA